LFQFDAAQLVAEPHPCEPIVVVKLFTSFSFLRRSSMGFTYSEVTSSLVPGSASRLMVKRSTSVLGKKSFLSIHVTGSISDITNIHNTHKRNFIEFFLFFKTFSSIFSYNISILSSLMNHLFRYFHNFENLEFLETHILSKVTASAGFMVSAITREESRVTVIMKGIENMNLPIIHVMKSMAEKIHTTVRVVDIRTFL
jgi:hypothetical protein